MYVLVTAEVWIFEGEIFKIILIYTNLFFLVVTKLRLKCSHKYTI